MVCIFPVKMLNYFSGNVGIGTTAPGQKLEVSGDVLATNLRATTDLYLAGTALSANTNTTSGASKVGLYDDVMTYISSNTNVQSAIKQLDTAIGTVSGSAGGWTDDGAIVRLATSGDRVGIGTTSVNANTKLGVLGGVAIGSQTYSDAQAPSNGLIVEGNVGIGTTAPGAALDVAGNILVNNGGSIDTRAAGTLTIGGSTQTGLTLGRAGATTNINGSSVIVNSLTGMIKGTSGTLSALTSTAGYAAYWSDANTVSGEQYLNLTRGGTSANLSGVAQGGLIYKGASALAGSGALSGLVQGNGSSAPTAITGTANYLPKWSAAAPYLTGTSLIFDNGTNVGIGTTAPGQKLEVSGDILATNLRATTDLYLAGTALSANTTTTSGASKVGLYDDAMTYITSNTNVQSAIKQLDTAIGTVSGSAGGWTDDGAIVRLATSTDRVGIGTTSVNANTKLGILGGVAIGSQTYSDAQGSFKRIDC